MCLEGRVSARRRHPPPAHRARPAGRPKGRHANPPRRTAPETHRTPPDRVAFIPRAELAPRVRAGHAAKITGGLTEGWPDDSARDHGASGSAGCPASATPMPGPLANTAFTDDEHLERTLRRGTVPDSAPSRPDRRLHANTGLVLTQHPTTVSGFARASDSSACRGHCRHNPTPTRPGVAGSVVPRRAGTGVPVIRVPGGGWRLPPRRRRGVRGRGPAGRHAGGAGVGRGRPWSILARVR